MSSQTHYIPNIVNCNENKSTNFSSVRHIGPLGPHNCIFKEKKIKLMTPILLSFV